LGGIIAKYDECEQLNRQCYEMHKQIAAMQGRITQLLAEVDELRAADKITVTCEDGTATEVRT
jgi:prefoldin subunit 5